ncbi:hypothetical protein [Robbsia sp. KACC 23696]|uniref:hypothetical protein n=1 Tax=Robbsia sp. KACC 23696 TaxID=3149231 RepID=UPI00325BAA7A
MTSLHHALSFFPAHALAWFFGGLFATNAIPHFVSGVMGRPFQTPFASPPGEGLSSSTINVLWGFANLIFAWLLLAHVGDFDIRNLADALPFALGVLAIALFSARHFGRFHGGTLNAEAKPHA